MFQQLFDTDSSTYTYLLADDETHEAVLIDPVLEQIDRDLALLLQHGLKLVAILDTHVHADHITGAAALKANTHAATAVGLDCAASGYDRGLSDGDGIAFGHQRLEAIATPGHTPGSMSFLWHDGLTARVFTGDALLIGGCGRTDFQGGSSLQMWHSVTQRLFTLPPATEVWPGHDYRGNTHSTIGSERLSNPRFVGQTAESFAALMSALRLPPPRLIETAVPANKRAGEPVQEA
jgi:sulfur dioxygenase